MERLLSNLIRVEQWWRKNQPTETPAPVWVVWAIRLGLGFFFGLGIKNIVTVFVFFPFWLNFPPPKERTWVCFGSMFTASQNWDWFLLSFFGIETLSFFPSFFVVWFLARYAATQLVIEVQQEHIHLVRSTREARKLLGWRTTILICLSFFLGFRWPNLITGLSGWRAPD